MNKIIIFSIIGIHFLIISTNIASKHLSFGDLYDLTSQYTFPYFPQEWEMFAPPPTSNTRLYFRYITYMDNNVDTSEFKEVLRPLYRRQVKDIYSLARLSYYLQNCAQNMYLNYGYCLDHMPDSIKVCGDREKAEYISRRLSTSYSHAAILEYGRNVYNKENPSLYPDSVRMSYHLLDVSIPDFKDRYNKLDPNSDQEDQSEVVAWNSSFFKIF